MINFNSKYCSWTVRPSTAKGIAPLTLFTDVAQIRAWLIRPDTTNARIHGISRNTAREVTRSLVTGGRTALRANALINKQLGL